MELINLTPFTRALSLFHTDFVASQMYTVDCEASHRFCFDCVKRGVETSIQTDKKTPSCPMCSYTITPQEVQQLFPGNDEIYQQLLEIGLKNTLAGSGDYIACPTAGCKSWFEMPAGAGGAGAGGAGAADEPRARVKCSECQTVFCSSCKERYHYTHGCAEVAAISERWFSWLNKERKKWHKQLNKDHKIVSLLRYPNCLPCGCLVALCAHLPYEQLDVSCQAEVCVATIFHVLKQRHDGSFFAGVQVLQQSD